MMNEIKANGSITVGFDVFDDFQFYSGGEEIYHPSPIATDTGLNHAVKLFGWGEIKCLGFNTTQKYWIGV